MSKGWPKNREQRRAAPGCFLHVKVCGGCCWEQPCAGRAQALHPPRAIPRGEADQPCHLPGPWCEENLRHLPSRVCLRLLPAHRHPSSVCMPTREAGEVLPACPFPGGADPPAAAVADHEQQLPCAAPQTTSTGPTIPSLPVFPSRMG